MAITFRFVVWYSFAHVSGNVIQMYRIPGHAVKNLKSWAISDQWHASPFSALSAITLTRTMMLLSTLYHRTA